MSVVVRPRATGDASPRGRRSRTLNLVLLVAAGLIFLGFMALGSWQVMRLQWKLALIARVEARVHAPPAAPPARQQWAQVTAGADEYRHVIVGGTFLYGQSVRVQAVTVLGGGFWLLTPLRTADGTVVLVNRGFVRSPSANSIAAADMPATAGAPLGTVVSVTGLLRMSEPDGAFLRHNDAVANRWYSRDVRAIAGALRLAPVAPYFIDADAASSARTGSANAGDGEQAVGGLTVIAFHNSHLVYALTWFALALMTAAASLYSVRMVRRLPPAGT